MSKQQIKPDQSALLEAILVELKTLVDYQTVIYSKDVEWNPDSDLASIVRKVQERRAIQG